jgi:hypothetical protein
MKGWALLPALLALGACSRQAEEAQVPIADYTAGPKAVVAPPARAVPPPSTARDPKVVLIAWAKAMSLKQWDSAYLYWEERGVATGLTLDQFRAKWSKLNDPQFDLYPGKSEGAAGSSFYTAPVVLIDGKRKVKGEIVLRRVNDVDGASAEQLRWHIESLTIEP